MAQRSLWFDPAVEQQPRVEAQPMQSSNLAAALMSRQQPFTLPAPSMGISPYAMKAMGDAFKGETDPVKYGMPGQTVDPRTGMGSTPLGYDPYGNMTPEEIAGQTASVQPFGAAGTPSAAYNPTSIPPSWFDRMLGGGGGASGGTLSAPVSSAPGWFDNGGMLARLFGGGGG